MLGKNIFGLKMKAPDLDLCLMLRQMLARHDLDRSRSGCVISVCAKRKRVSVVSYECELIAISLSSREYTGFLSATYLQFSETFARAYTRVDRIPLRMIF